jgi:hypothetical protein
MSNPDEQLRAIIDTQLCRLRVSIPSPREDAIIALVHAQERLTFTTPEAGPDIITGRHVHNLGGNLALRLCLEAPGGDITPPPESSNEMGSWAEGFLASCTHLIEAGTVLSHCETGFMRLASNGSGTYNAWIARKQIPTSWRERIDIDSWAASLARCHEPELQTSQTGTSHLHDNALYRRLADVHLKVMAYQFAYPPEGVIGGCTVQTWLDIVEQLISRALRARDYEEAASPQPESALIAGIASSLAIAPAVVTGAIAALTLDRENAAWHATVPGVAAAPIIRVAPDQVILSTYGLTTEPLLFLTRELRRRDAQDYHNASWLREVVFRQDLYALFADKRFVTSTGRINLRRDAGNICTDIDAVIFDRKTGTLGVFELKSQDPFARSTEALARQRDSVLYANRQIAGVLAWLKQHGGDDLLGRVDRPTAKRFRVHKVYPFVLGRYLAHFGDADGPEPDRRAAWGTWPQILRLMEQQPIRANDANPIASLFTRLTKDVPHIQVPAESPPRMIPLGETCLTVYPSYAALQATTDAIT